MASNGNKIIHHHQNFIDNGLIYLCNQIDRPLYRMGVTPNMITLFGLFTGLLSIHFLVQKRYVLSIAFLWITYFTDCLDGYMARKYNLTTKLGDYLDHFRDQFVILSIISICVLQIRKTKYKLLFILLIAFFGLLMLSQLGCQEKLTQYNDHNDCLKILKCFCPGNAEDNIEFTKWFGCGTFFMVLSIFIFSIQFHLFQPTTL